MTYALLLLELFWEFLKIGVFAVGGGMATLPFLYDLGEKTAWYTSAQVLDMLAVSESTPGPIGINMATYVGYTVGGVPGAVLATLGTILPGIILVIVLARFLARFHDNRYVNAAFYGLRPASTALIAAAGIGVLGESLFNPGLYGETGKAASPDDLRFRKPTFPSLELAEWLKGRAYQQVELCGLVSHICVLSNAVMVKAALPETEIVVDAALTASYDPVLHEKALDVLEGLQITVLHR